MLTMNQITTLVRVAQEMANEAGVPMYLVPYGDSLRITREKGVYFEKFSPVRWRYEPEEYL